MSDMFSRIAVAVRPLPGYRLHVRFDDGVEGEIDFRKHMGGFRGVFEPLNDPAFFATVYAHRSWGTVSWPGELDVDPVLVYSTITGLPLPRVSGKPDSRSPRRARSPRPARRRT